MKTKSNKGANRHGKHSEDKVQFGGMVTPEFKALAQLTASVCKCSLMDLMMDGIRYKATEAGIMVNGSILPQFEEAIAGLAGIIRAKLESKRG